MKNSMSREKYELVPMYFPSPTFQTKKNKYFMAEN